MRCGVWILVMFFLDDLGNMIVNPFMMGWSTPTLFTRGINNTLCYQWWRRWVQNHWSSWNRGLRR